MGGDKRQGPAKDPDRYVFTDILAMVLAVLDVVRPALLLLMGAMLLLAALITLAGR